MRNRGSDSGRWFDRETAVAVVVGKKDSKKEMALGKVRVVLDYRYLSAVIRFPTLACGVENDK